MDIWIFLWKRLLGLGLIVDGLSYIFLGRSWSLAVRAGRRVAKIRGVRIITERAVRH